MEGFGAKILDTLRALPLWLIVALAATGAIILYAPPVPGLDLAGVRKEWWLAPSALLAWCMAVAGFGARAFTAVVARTTKALEARPAPTLRLTVTSQINKTWWSASEQRDGTWVTQFCVDFAAYNPSGHSVRIVSSRLIRPVVRSESRLPAVHTLAHPDGGREHSPNYAVRPHGHATGRAVLMVKRKLGRAGKFITVTVGLTDQNGYEHRVRVRLWPATT